jgi:cell division septal protein FtsQ
VTRKRIVTVLALLLVVLLAGGAVFAVWFSNLLDVERVRVIGAGREEEVLASAAIDVGVPIARVDTIGVQQRVSEIPWVRTVDVRRGWPSEIVIAVTEREAVARKMSGGGAQGVDAEGVVFAPQAELPEDLIVVTADGPALLASVEVLQALPPEIKGRVTRVAASTRDDVRLHLKSGSIVRWGSAQEPEFKSQVLLALLPRRARVYDVSAPQLPTTLDENPRKRDAPSDGVSSPP